MVKIWRDHRSLVMKEVMEQAEVVGLPRAAEQLKPDIVDSMEEWQTFVKSRSTEEFREKSKRFKSMREKRTLLHTTSRKSFACLEAELKQQSETPDAISRSDVWLRAYEAKQKKGSTEEAVDSEIVKQVKKYKEEEETVSGPSSIKNDAAAKVLGPDPRGRVRGYGFGALPSKVDAQLHVSNKVTMLENALAAQTQVVDKLQEMVRGLCARLNQGGINNEHTSAQQSVTEIGNRKRKENPIVRSTGSDIAQRKQKDASVRSSYNETENGRPIQQSFNGKKQQDNPKKVQKTCLGKQV
ncbi:putative transposase, Ptta/En/Spm, plant [Rosa chinensis]|uniref:Putative transposase, Ptta/En/Spm, plant n=1 Tax=Rosa chinensis TaxID=74649 RepID=A0A2P6R1A3_ROSCH|nr:putative transposase, Ptta/En/Spm, plant [Rosa chinensis]